MREYKRSIDKATREIEKERTKLQNQEKKIIADIKKAAKDGQMVRSSAFTSLLIHSQPPGACHFPPPPPPPPDDRFFLAARPCRFAGPPAAPTSA